MSMNKSAYSRRLNPLLSGKGNFVTDSQDKLEAVVRSFVDTAFNHYNADGNVKHVEGATLAMSYMHPAKAVKAQNIIFKACKELRGNHNAFTLTIPLLSNGRLNPSEHKFTYKKLDKKLRPAVLPSLDKTLRDVNTALDALYAKKASTTTDAQKQERAVKRTTSTMLDFSDQLVAMKAMGLEDRAEWIKGMTSLLVEADKVQNPTKYKAKAKAKAKAKPKAKRTTGKRAGKPTSSVGEAVKRAANVRK